MVLSSKENRTITRNVLLGVLAGSVALYTTPVYAGDNEESSSSTGGSPAQTVINQVTDLSMDWLAADTVEVNEDGDKVDVNVAGSPSSGEFQVFANMGYGHLTRDVKGGEVKSNSTGVDLGLAKTIESASGNKLTFAPVIDYGHGKFDSYSDQWGKTGHGKTNYVAGGGMVRKSMQNGFYYEGSLRYGRNKLDYTQEGWISDDASAPVWSGHLHVGRQLKVDPQSILKVYGMYHYTHQKGMDLNKFGYKMSSSNSGRARVGAKITRYKSKTQSFYSELAYQYDYSGAVDTYGNGWRMKGKSAHGSSGMLKLGWNIRQSARSSSALDVNVTGWVGKQHGVTAGVNFKTGF